MQTTSIVSITPTHSTLTRRDHWDHFLARWGYRRGSHRVQPGLYNLGNPDENSPVFVTANYTLSFDALRSALDGVDAYILVLNTRGINVWCAAGKGTFSTDELVDKIETTGLRSVVRHRQLILPQLGAPGVSAHEVKRRSHFKIEYGPVRASDLKEYLKTHQASVQMRKVEFPLVERLVLIPIEIVHFFLPFLIAFVLLWLLLGTLAAWGVLAAGLSGTFLFPILLPWLPTRQFSLKGFFLGALVALPFAILAFSWNGATQPWMSWVFALSFLSGISSVTAYLALNFTGATPITSQSAVQREMSRFMPWMAILGGVCLVSLAVLIIFKWLI